MTRELQDDLARRFQSLSLSKGEWTHAAHLLVGAWHVERLGIDEAAGKMREGIRKLNSSFGGVNSETEGYHETLTIFWLRVIARALKEGTGLADIAALPSGLWREYYSRDLPSCRVARREWVEPDLKPINP